MAKRQVISDFTPDEDALFTRIATTGEFVDKGTTDVPVHPSIAKLVDEVNVSGKRYSMDVDGETNAEKIRKQLNSAARAIGRRAYVSDIVKLIDEQPQLVGLSFSIGAKAGRRPGNTTGTASDTPESQASDTDGLSVYSPDAPAHHGTMDRGW